LRRVLTALRQGVDESARLARVGDKLGPFLDAVPPQAAAGAAAAAASGGQKVGVLKLLLGGLAAVTSVFLYFQFSGPGKAERDTGAAGDVAVTAAPAPQPALPTPLPTNQVAPEASQAPERTVAELKETKAVGLESAPTPESARTGRASRSGRSTPSGRMAHARSGEHNQAPTSGKHSESSATDTAPEQPAAAPAKPSPADSEPSVAALAARAPEKSGAEVAAVETSERIPTEAELLFQARKALTSDAALALRTVTEHEVRYPKGRLTPEREVLAIEALRQLGRTAEAEARLQRFEARYPKSLHLKRLKQKN
jgi:hypothetical protein